MMTTQDSRQYVFPFEGVQVEMIGGPLDGQVFHTTGNSVPVFLVVDSQTGDLDVTVGTATAYELERTAKGMIYRWKGYVT